MLGSTLSRVLGQEHFVYSTDICDTAIFLDICNKESIKEVFALYEPEFVIHCAAYTDVEGCTQDPEKAFKINALGTSLLAQECNLRNIPILYISTDYVFNGLTNTSYTEFDDTDPINIYGKSKVAGELLVKEATKEFYIVRTSWLFDPTHKNFATTILRKLKEEGKPTIEVVHNQTGSPTYAEDLANYILNYILPGAPFGTYHFSNSGKCSWYEFAKEIQKQVNLFEKEIVPIVDMGCRASTRRPFFSVLDNFKSRIMGWEEARSWKEAVEDFVLCTRVIENSGDTKENA